MQTALVQERRESEDAEELLPEDAEESTPVEEELERPEETERSDSSRRNSTREDFVLTAKELQEEDAERSQESSEDLAELELSDKSREERSPSERLHSRDVLASQDFPSDAELASLEETAAEDVSESTTDAAEDA